MYKFIVLTLWFIVLMILCGFSYTDNPSKWEITAYCICKKCCGLHANGITASGKQIEFGMAACNWLPFGTKVKIKGFGTFVIEDRGSRSLFGDRNNHIKHLDIYLPSHSDAVIFGTKWREVEILAEKK